MSVVSVWNKALTLAGARGLIASEDERTREREICSTWYDHIRRTVLGGAFWPSSRKRLYLSLLQERDTSISWAAGDPAPGYQYLYAIPTDLLRPRFLADYSQFEEFFDHTRSNGEGARVLSANMPEAILEYSFDQTNPVFWEPTLENAIVFNLAAVICNSLNAKENKTQRLFQQANDMTMEARVAFANVSNAYQETIPDWIAVRGYADGAPKAQYFFPYAPFFSGAFTSGQFLA